MLVATTNQHRTSYHSNATTTGYTTNSTYTYEWVCGSPVKSSQVQQTTISCGFSPCSHNTASSCIVLSDCANTALLNRGIPFCVLGNPLHGNYARHKLFLEWYHPLVPKLSIFPALHWSHDFRPKTRGHAVQPCAVTIANAVVNFR